MGCVTLYRVETGVPLPPSLGGPTKRHIWSPDIARTRKYKPRAYPFDSMGIGDSFLVLPAAPDPGVYDLADLQQLLGERTRSCSKATGQSFTTRRIDGGVRVWRVA